MNDNLNQIIQSEPVIDLKKTEQFLANIQIITELNTSHPNIDLLKSYKGFGGLKQCFNSKQLYGKLMNAIRGIAGKEREHEIFNILRHSCKSAYYTPKEIVTFMYRYVTEVCSFTGGDILEPACGNGVFFEHMPESIMSDSIITGVEMDFITSKIVKCIYPKINIMNNSLQNINFAGKAYDLIIGNPPYSGEKIIDLVMPDISNYTIHHYFAAKGVRLLKKNGILAFVLPSYFFDIPLKNTRVIIDGEAVLIDAVRLPENLFQHAKITVDIVIFRKAGNKIHSFANTVRFECDNKADNINEYWQSRPHRVLGELSLKWVDAYKRYVPCCVTDNKDKILNYLINCKFDCSTFENYYAISRGKTEEIYTNEIPVDASNLLSESFIAVEELFLEVSGLIPQVNSFSIALNHIRERLIKIQDDLWIIQQRLGLVDNSNN
ncbi:MAG: SAM-dependent methyltransferase [Burkholderiales bacterium]|nr:SAM-dependent methyltransferase [Burkholderiales bacterium]